MSAGNQKISLYNVNDLKNATDDALAPYLTSLKKPYTFKQQHRATDVRLAAGYAAVTIAGILFYADWKLGWDATKAYTAPACVVYFLLNGFFTYWIWAVEAGTVFVGVREGGQKLTLKSFGKKHSPTYRLRVCYEAPSGQKWVDEEVQGSYTQWFHANGYLDQPSLKSWLRKNIEVVRLADPDTSDMPDDATILAIASGLENTSSASKRSKKA